MSQDRPRGRVPIEEAEVKRRSWSNQPDGFRLRIGFKRPITDEEREDHLVEIQKTSTVEREEHKLFTLLRQHPEHEDNYVRRRSEVTKDVVIAAVEHALYLYCENRFDPEDVCVHNVTIGKYREIRSLSAPNENSLGVSQPHSSGELPGWADE